MKARYNWGRWIGDCVCNSAVALTRGQTMFHCAACGRLNPIEWPPNRDAIEHALAERPLDFRGEQRWSSWNPGETLEMLETENTNKPWLDHPAFRRKIHGPVTVRG